MAIEQPDLGMNLQVADALLGKAVVECVVGVGAPIESRLALAVDDGEGNAEAELEPVPQADRDLQMRRDDVVDGKAVVRLLEHQHLASPARDEAERKVEVRE